MHRTVGAVVGTTGTTASLCACMHAHVDRGSTCRNLTSVGAVLPLGDEGLAAAVWGGASDARNMIMDAKQIGRLMMISVR